MSEQADVAPPIIIKRIKRSAHAHHGGSWKVAFADFATAMMAFFLLLWLMGNTDEAEKQAISGYFNDPAGQLDKAGANPQIIGEGGANAAVINIENVKPETDDNVLSEDAVVDEQTIAQIAEALEMEKLQQLQLELQTMVENVAAFKQFKDQVLIDITPDGLRIQIIDKDKRPMFDSGSPELKYYSKTILRGLADVLKRVPNKLSITGHTDATPYVERENYGNWELSSDRANAARRELQLGGIVELKIARVEGFSSSILFDDKRPHDAVNRRIAIIVLKRSAAENIEKQVRGEN